MFYTAKLQSVTNRNQITDPGSEMRTETARDSGSDFSRETKQISIGMNELT